MTGTIKKYGLPFGFADFGELSLLDTRSRRRIPRGCRCRAAVLFPYYNPRAFGGNISCYCAVEDYHKVAGGVLKEMCARLSKKYPGEKFVPFTDASPVAEADMREKAGLGTRGDNGLLINPRHGSFVFIGEILTTLPLPRERGPFYPEGESGGFFRACLHCGACRRACPGGAISGGRVDRARCASFISQKKGRLSREEIRILKKAGTVFGCDICQRICPANRDLPEEKNLFSENIINLVTRENAPLLYKDRAFGFRGLPLLLRNLEIFREAINNG